MILHMVRPNNVVNIIDNVNNIQGNIYKAALYVKFVLIHFVYKWKIKWIGDIRIDCLAKTQQENVVKDVFE